jgi:N-acetylglutamate synthase
MTDGPARWGLRLRLTPEDVGRRVVVRWRRPTVGGPDEVADVLGELAAMDQATLRVVNRDGVAVVIPLERALAGKVVPPPPARRR